MLVLTRKESETIHIGENVVIKVTRIGSNAVKIGIDAPESVRVLRGELVPQETVAVPVSAAAFGPLRVHSERFPHVA
jgi:carbon storage regulator